MYGDLTMKHGAQPRKPVARYGEVNWVNCWGLATDIGYWGTNNWMYGDLTTGK
jgi:hypothetical protein